MPTPPDPSDLPMQVRRARWWYWIALAVVANLLALPTIALFLLLWLLLGGSLWTVLFWLSFLFLGGAAALLNLLLPVAVYKDVQVVDRAGDVVDWDPDRTVFVGGAVAGVFVPLVAPAVAAYWIYQRRAHMGIP